MGSILSKISNDYENYESLCGFLNIKPKSVSSFIEHEEQILKDNNLTKTYNGYIAR